MAPPPQIPQSSQNDWNDNGDNVTLESVQEKTAIYLPIASNYASHWDPIVAFRELVQNWRDGIIQSSGIAEDSFRVARLDYEDVIIFTADGIRKSPTGWPAITECLGYIRWFKQNGVGTVEVTNRQATLQPWHLDMGGTSKKDQPTQAGAHGEGLKVALLVMLRRPQNHAVQCRSGGFQWIFNFTNKRRLVANLARMTPTAIENARDQATKDAKSGMTPFAASPNEDIQFFIGGGSMGRDENGIQVRRDGVTREQFTSWTRSALFLQDIQDNEIVRTEAGDLILAPRFSGNIYLKGLLLKESVGRRSASITGKPLRYGYNFAGGITTREREFLKCASDELIAILRIWTLAFRLKDGLVAEFHKLLNSEEPEFADVSGAEHYISHETRYHMKVYILREFKDKWLYAAKEKSQNIRFDQIVEGLGRQPLEIKESYWSILASCGFRTAEEEEQKIFLPAESIYIPATYFARSLYRLLRALLEACPQTADATVVFVKAGSVGLGSFYSHSQRLFKVHEKWVTVEGARLGLGFFTYIPESSLLFNSAKRLFADAITQVPVHLFPRGQHSLYWCQKQAISQGDQRLLEYTQIKQDLDYMVKREENSDTLLVWWESSTGWARNVPVSVHFHLESTCSHLKSRLTSGKVQSRMVCTMSPDSPRGNCAVRTVPFDTGFCSLQVKKGVRYFIMLANQSDPSSFLIHSDKPSPIDQADNVFQDLAQNPGAPRSDNGKTTFILYDRLEPLDTSIPRMWFTSVNLTGTGAVIGIAHDDIHEIIPSPQPIFGPGPHGERGGNYGDEN
ncbi:hypothetical protein F4811DRAFT_376039 [Daldinia bambusicola]|nr:hypothetical protein F4811DRAFT_376039 [Daldinia bambusicola]